MKRLATREQRTIAVLSLTFVTLWTFGTLGWHSAMPDIAWREALYRSLQLFSLNFDEPPHGVPPLLEAARFVQPAFTLLAFAASLSAQVRLALRTLTTLRSEQITIVGYGVAGKAAAERFRTSRPHARLVALDHSVTESDRQASRRIGVELIECDVLDKEARDRFAIGLKRSQEVVIACGSDETNLSLLDELRVELTGLSHHVRLWLYLSSHRLAERLRESYSSGGYTTPVVEFVEVSDNAAQAIVLAHPLVPEARAARLNRVHVVVHGFDNFGWLSVEQVLLNGIAAAPALTMPRVTVVVDAADRARAAWNARHPRLGQFFDVRFLDPGDGAIGWGDPQDPLLNEIEDELPPSLHIFAGAHSEEGIAAALALRDGMRRGIRSVAPIAVRSDHRRLSGGDLAEPSGVLQLRFTIVDSYDTAISAFGVIGHVLEERARSFHRAYAQGEDVTPFDQLSQSQRLSNRRAAFHLLEKLRILGFEEARPVDIAFGVAPEGIALLKMLPTDQQNALDRLENLRWRTDRLLEGWRAGPRNTERRLRPGLTIDHSDVQPSAPEQYKDRSQFDDFLAQATGQEPARAGAMRILDIGWEGLPLRWERTPKLSLVTDPDLSWPPAEPGTIHRLCLIVPPLPSGGDGADQDAEEVRVALADCAADLLSDAPNSARIRFLRPTAAPWNWLDVDPLGRVDGVTLPRFVVGFTGHRHPERLGDVDRLIAILRHELRSTIPIGTELVCGLATGGDALMVRLWDELGLGPISAYVPYLGDDGASTGPDADDRIPDDLLRRCDTVTQPSGLSTATDTERHVAVADALLERATLLIALSDGASGGAGGVEDTVARMRARGGLVRYIPVSGYAP